MLLDFNALSFQSCSNVLSCTLFQPTTKARNYRILYVNSIFLIGRQLVIMFLIIQSYQDCLNNQIVNHFINNSIAAKPLLLLFLCLFFRFSLFKFFFCIYFLFFVIFLFCLFFRFFIRKVI